jgi:hopanoid C-2 methylase
VRVGFDSDGADTAEKAIAFVRETQISIIGFNLLYALPSTPLWRRLEQEGRLIPDSEADETNIQFKLPYEVVAAQYRRVVDVLYSPSELYEGFRSNAIHTYSNRKDLPLSRFP